MAKAKKEIVPADLAYSTDFVDKRKRDLIKQFTGTDPRFVYSVPGFESNRIGGKKVGKRFNPETKKMEEYDARPTMAQYWGSTTPTRQMLRGVVANEDGSFPTPGRTIADLLRDVVDTEDGSFPEQTVPEQEEAAEEARIGEMVGGRRRRRQGRASTILTGARGLLGGIEEEGGRLARRMLLGA